MQRPTLVVLATGNGLFAAHCSGRFGGGYSVRGLSRDQAIELLARDGRAYDCGTEPILLRAPPDMLEAAGRSPRDKPAAE
jgi:hypothetical protein